MDGQRIGYIRVSSFDQNPERQLEHVGEPETGTQLVFSRKPQPETGTSRARRY